MSSEHVEVLRDLSEVCRAAIKAGDWKVDGACDPDAVLRRADAAIAALSAPQPPAEAPRCTCPSGDGSLRWPCPAHPPEAQQAPSAPVGVEEHEGAMTSADYIEHCAGVLREHGYRVTASTLADIATEHRALAQQPAAVGGDNPYPAPRNRQEAAALAKLALAYLGVTSAHIDAAVARCETDLAAQQGGSTDE